MRFPIFPESASIIAKLIYDIINQKESKMHSIKLNIDNEIFEKFMGLIDILPKESINIEEIDSIPYYPSISFEEAQKKVQKSVTNISNNEGKDSDIFFKELLS